MEKDKRYKLVIFDFDNTLYDGHHYALRLVLHNLRHALWAKAERKVRLSLAGADMKDGAALRLEMTKRLAEATGIDVSRISTWYSEKYLPSMARTLKSAYMARQGAKETIKALINAGIKVCVLSDYPNTEQRMEAIGLNDNRIGKWSAEEMGALKPSARPFIEVAHAMGVEPTETLAIGDRADTDGAGAKAAGMDALLIEGKRATAGCGFDVMSWDDVCKFLISKTLVI